MVGNGFGAATLSGGGSPWVKETLPAIVKGSPATVHADDEISVITDANDNVYIATETQRTHITSTGSNLDPQVIVWKRTPAGVWTQSDVKMDQSSTSGDLKRPVVAIHGGFIYVIAIDQQQSFVKYYRASLTIGLPTNTWQGPTTLFDTEFETYRNNIVPRDPIPAGQKLPVLVDYPTVWQTSLPLANDNQAPGVFAGADTTVSASPATGLDGRITTDGLGGPVNWQWTVVTGPPGAGAGVVWTGQSGSCGTSL
jgi:hypothetical protein